MSALIINGLEIPVSAEGWQESVEEIGVRQRAYSGSALSSIRAQKRLWSGSVASTDATLIRAIRGLIAGDGHYWSFDADLYSDGKGLPPSVYAYSTLVAGGKYGNALRVTANKSASWHVGFGAPYTVCVFAHDGDGEFQHRAIVDNGSGPVAYCNGSPDNLPGWLSVSNGKLTLSATAAWVWDELVATPYTWPLSWITAMRDRTTPMQATPILDVSGDLVSPSAECLGRIGRMSATSLGSSILQRLEFELQEV